MILSVVLFGNFFHFNVTAGNFKSLLCVEIHGNVLSVTETIYCDRLALPPYPSAITHIVTSDHLFKIMSLPYVCDEFPFL